MAIQTFCALSTGASERRSEKLLSRSSSPLLPPPQAVSRQSRAMAVNWVRNIMLLLIGSAL